MSKDNKTITLQELPELNQISDDDIFIITDGKATHKVTGKNLIQYMKSHDDIADYFVHQDTVGSANGIAALDGNKKILSENIPFGSQTGSVYEGISGKALETTVATKADKTELASHVTDQASHITSTERSNWNDSNAKKHTHSNKTALGGITAPLITGWNNAAAHISDSAKHITGNERALWNTVNDKVTKVDGKALSSNDFSNAEKAKLQGIESGANLYRHPDTDGSRHIPANGTTNGGKYLKATSTAGSYKWENLTKADVESALGYTPSGSESVTYALSKSGSNIILTGSDGSKTSIPDADTTYTLSDFGITSSSSEINHLKGVKSNVQTQLNNVYTKNEANTLLNDKLAKAGDGSNLTTAFTEASTLAAINTGEKLSVIMGKVKKSITSLISHTATAATASVSGHVKVDSALSSASTNPVQNKAVNTALAGKLATTGNASNTTVAYTEATALTELASGEKQSVAFGKLKLAVKNVISFARLLGSTDISAVGGGTVTGAISSLNSNLMYGELSQTDNPLGVGDSLWHYFYPDGSLNYPQNIKSGTIFCKTLFSKLDYGTKLAIVYHMDSGTYYTLAWHKAEAGNASLGWETQWHTFGDSIGILLDNKQHRSNNGALTVGNLNLSAYRGVRLSIYLTDRLNSIRTVTLYNSGILVGQGYMAIYYPDLFYTYVHADFATGKITLSESGKTASTWSREFNIQGIYGLK